MIGVNVPGIGMVPVTIRRSLKVHNPDGTAELRVFIDIDVPPPPGGGEPLPLEVAS